MNQTFAATAIATGLIALAWAISIWKKHPNGESRWIPFLAVIAGVGIGVGAGFFAGINLIQYKVGVIPLWVIFVAVVGFLFFLEMKGWENHRTRTPILGFLTALVLMLAVGQAVVKVSTQEIQHARTTSQIVPASTPKKG